MIEKNILIVEDEMISALFLKRILQNAGYTICGITATGEEAIEMSKDLKPDLILMDIILDGEIDGIEATERIHKNGYIPIVYVTASSDKETYKRAKKTKIAGYITKPYKEKEIVNEIKGIFTL